MIFHLGKEFLRPHPKFLPEVVARFHLNQTIHLSIFFLELLSEKAGERLYPMSV